MEGGQKTNIPLDSGLDVHSSDMLVSVQQPKFQHNRQKYQGKYLPTSMRFEHDGWAAGNDVYQFKVNEAQVEAGSYIVTKSYVNGNPTYKLGIRDKDMYLVSSVFYNNKSSIKSSTASDVDVSTGVNPEVSGSISGKPFVLEYDSIKGTVSKKDGSADIVLVSSVQNTDYSIEIKLQDKASQIQIGFAGLGVPGDLYNGEYLLGSFSLYKNFGKADTPDYRTLWTDSQFNCYYNGSQFWIEDSNGTRMTDYYAAVPGGDGEVHLSFTVPLVFYDNMVVYTQDFVPFFSGMTNSNSSKVVNTQSSESYNINKWSFSMYDPENTAPAVSDKLYRNLPEYSGGASDRNRQLLDQAVPMWFGVNAYADWLNTDGLTVTKPSGTVLASGSWDYDVVHYFGYDDEHIYFQRVQIKCTDSIQKYDGVTHKCHFTMWEHTVDATDKAKISYHNNGFTVKFVFGIYENYDYITTDPYTGDHTNHHREHITTKEISVTLDSTYSYNDWGNIRDMFFDQHDNRTDIYLYYITVDNEVVWSVDDDHPVGSVMTWQGVTLDISGSKFWQSGGLTIVINSQKGCSIRDDSLVLKGQLSSLGPNISYNNHNIKIEDWTSSTGSARFIRCCMAHVLSELFIKSESLLTPSLDATVFQLNEIEPSASSNTLYYSELFRHKINSAFMSQGNLSLTINLCAKENSTYLFYTDNRSTDNSISVCPGHILYNDIKKVTDYEAGNISALSIAKSYIGVINIEYGLTINISAAAAQTSSETLFNYIQTADNIYAGELLSGNKFTEEYADQLQSDILWDFSGLPKFKVVLNPDSGRDIDQIQVTGQEIIVTADDKQVAKYNYDLASSIPDGTGVITNYLKSGYSIGMQLEYIDSYDPDIMLPVNAFHVKYTTSADYDLHFKGTKSLDSYLQLESFQNNIAVLVQPGRYKIEVNYSSSECGLYIWDSTEEKWGPAQDADEVFGDNYSFTLSSSDIRTIQAVLLGIYDPDNMEVVSITPSVIKAVVNGEEIAIDISSKGLFNKNIKSDVQFCYTRVNSPVLEDIPFANLESESEFQFLKQQWDTTNETENFWWIDKDNVLVLTKSHFVLRCKASAISGYDGVLIDDWNGDIFVDVKKWRRFDYLPSSVIKYIGTCAYRGDSAKFVTLSVSGSTLNIKVYDPLKDMSMVEYDVQFSKRELGTALNTSSDKIYTYSDLDYESAVSKAQISATCVDGNLILGVHVDNNFNQWALIIGSYVRVMQGYGYVGLNGSLTGGEIPAKYFSVQAGFSGVVQPLSKLSDRSYNISRLEELYQLTDMVVGTDSQQWYISKNIPSIVSHIEYNRGIFTAREIKLNNNYAVKYASSSYKAVNFSNYKLNVKDMKNILPDSNSVWNAALSFMGRPQIYFLEPKITIANYLQQTLGQAAYVHYNSTSISRNEDPAEESTAKNFSAESALEQSKETLQKAAILSDEVSFDRQSVKQTQNTKSPYSTVFTLFAAALVSALDWGQDKLQVNKNQNQSATSDTGNKYSQMFLQNVNSMAASDMLINALNPSETSEVTALKTLDMFYSTSDKQEINAGPGYTEHNFVAMCIAQSVTSMQAEFLQQRMMYLITALTFYQIKITNKAAEITAEAAKVLVSALGGAGWVFAGPAGGGGTISSIGAMAAQVAYLAAITLKQATDIALDLLPPVLEALSGGKLNSTVTMHLPKHIYDVEGKHKYGAKSECFRWPCFGVSSAQSITDESVEVVTQNKAWALNTDVGSPVNQMDSGQPDFVTDSVSSSLQKNFVGQVPYHIAMVKGKQSKVTLPNNMSYVIGAESILPANDFKNQNIGLPEPSFNKPNLHDYMLDQTWQLSVAAGGGYQMWVSCKDTKLIDGAFSNIVVNSQFCGVASPYTAIEVKTGIQKQYLRPWAITSNAIALNNSGINCCFEEKAYHAFDGYSQRIVNWLGSPGLNKEFFVRLHSFFVNDRFKRSNMVAASHYTGNFQSEPSMAMPGDMTNTLYVNFDTTDTESSRNSIDRAIIGEVLGIVRVAIPVFSEFVNTLPAAVKTTDSVPLAVIQGITGLVSNVRDLQSAYKMPVSVDFTIGKTVYRYTQEYICEVKKAVTSGAVDLQVIVPCLGLDFIGSTPYEAYLYSHNTKQYYIFSGGSSLQLVNMVERFRDVLHGRYDFVNQEVLMPCVATFLRLDKDVLDDNDETDNIIVPRLKGGDFAGEVSPPLETIFNTRSGFRTVSLPCGITYQGPNRCIINRFCFQDYMLQQVKDNYGKWKRVPREKYHPFRIYKDKYSQVDISVESNVRGWTHNPFLLVTAPLGISENVDCFFEWEITFCWPVEMDKLYGPDNYAVVNMQAECMTPGGKVVADRPVHIFLKKDLFTRTGNYGYYSFRYQGKCGAGNRERLHIWSDQYICVSGLQCEYKPMTERRTEILTIQADVQGMEEI